MARARLLKPGFFKNEDLARLSPYHRLLFAGLWLIADKAGRLEDRPERIKVEVFPYDAQIDSAAVDAMCGSLHESGFIVRFGVKGGAGRVTRYIAIPAFLDHQTPHHREPESRIPAPPSRRSRPRAKPRARPQAVPEALPSAEPESSPSDPVTGDPVLVPDPVTGSRNGDGEKNGARTTRTPLSEPKQTIQQGANAIVDADPAGEFGDQKRTLALHFPEASDGELHTCLTRAKNPRYPRRRTEAT